MNLEVFKPGWQRSVGRGQAPDASELVEHEDFTYGRVVLKDFYLSHAAGLYLLQGASLEQLFSDVVVTIGDNDPDVYSLIFAEPPALHSPPPRIATVVLAHIYERPVNVPPADLLRSLFMQEMQRQHPASFS